MKHRRKSIRLKEWDYTEPGAYFVTICTHNREPLFGQVVDGEIVLNEYGQIVWEEWFRTATVRPNVELFEDEFVVMPNHVHGIIWIVDDTVGGGQPVAPPHRPPPRPPPTGSSTIQIIPCTWLGMMTNSSSNNSTLGRTSAVRNHSSHTIRPHSFNTISPSTTRPNRWARLCVQMVTKYAPGAE